MYIYIYSYIKLQFNYFINFIVMFQIKFYQLSTLFFFFFFKYIKNTTYTSYYLLLIFCFFFLELLSPSYGTGLPFLQSVHLHSNVHDMLARLHTQYFFKHFISLLQLHLPASPFLFLFFLASLNLIFSAKNKF